MLAGSCAIKMFVPPHFTQVARSDNTLKKVLYPLNCFNLTYNNFVVWPCGYKTERVTITSVQLVCETRQPRVTLIPQKTKCGDRCQIKNCL